MDRGGGHSSQSLGLLIQQFRGAAGLTQHQLASRAGLSLGALRDLEQGRTTRPRADSVARLAEVLQLSGEQHAELTVLASPRRNGAHGEHADGQDGDGQAQVRLAVLGPLVVSRASTPVAALGPPRVRAVLGLLAIHEQAGLSRAAMAAALWGDAPPATAAEMIQGYVSRLRRMLWPDAARDGGPRRDESPLFWDGTRYRLAAGAVHCDLAEFAQLVASARARVAAGQAGPASHSYQRALRLWRGAPLADLEILRGHPAIAGLDRRYADAVIEYADVTRATPLRADALRHLWLLAEREPLDERAHATLMTTLAACGQRATALRVYTDLRHRLDEELGVLPGPELAEAHLTVLRHEAGSAAGSGQPARGAPPGPAGLQQARPGQLPPDSGNFVGRAAELAQLAGLLGHADDEAPGTVVISAIGGMAGIGKSALAVHWAHQAAGEFPDGQLYVNLRGFGPSGNPVPPDEALRGFLQALGVPPQRIPADFPAQAGMYRSLVAGRRLLIVLDNGRDEEQVRPLLPASPSCLVVVTSRIQLTGLAAAEGARLVNLDVLTDAEARQMLIRRLGAGRVAADPAAVTELISLCGRLPLALAVSAARAASQPGFPLSALAAELRDDLTRLPQLGSGEPATSVHAVFSWSYQNLTVPAARMFRLLSLHPATGITTYAAASLAAIPLDLAREMLRELARAHLIAESAPDRYAFHDLLRAYAAGQGQSADHEDDRRGALTRLFDFYLAAAAAAMDTLAPAERQRRPPIPPPLTPLPPVDTPDAASAWLEAERATYRAVAGYTANRGWPEYTTRLSTILFRYYRDIGGHYADALAVHTHALHAAGQNGDLSARADALMNRGMVHSRQGLCQRAVMQIAEAANIFRDLADRRSQARAHTNMGVVFWESARYKPAAGHFAQALALHRELGDRFGEATALDNLGTALARQGHYQEARGHHKRAAAIRYEVGDRRGAARALGNLGAVLCWLGRHQEGASQLERALEMFREFDDRVGEADTMNDLGGALHGQGLHDDAIVCHRRALVMFRELGMRSSESIALNRLGDALTALGRSGAAQVHHRDALAVASEIENLHLEAQSHTGLAVTYLATGDLAQARSHWEHALDRYASLGAPEAAGVRAALSHLGC